MAVYRSKDFVTNNRTIYHIKEFINSNKRLLMIIAGVVVVIGLAVALISIFWNPSQNYNSEQLQQVVETETEQLTTNINDKMELPDETPIINTVTDKSQLTGELFKDAENGDKVLFYDNAGLIVIYREQTKEIIASGPAKSGSVTDSEGDVPVGVDQ